MPYFEAPKLYLKFISVSIFLIMQKNIKNLNN